MQAMTMSIAPPSTRPLTNEMRATDTRAERAATGADMPSDAAASTSNTATAKTMTLRNNEIAYDDKSGLMVVRTVEIGSGEVVAQNPSEAYLRLAQAMIATVRADDTETAGSGVIA